MGKARRNTRCRHTCTLEVALRPPYSQLLSLRASSLSSYPMRFHVQHRESCTQMMEHHRRASGGGGGNVDEIDGNRVVTGASAMEESRDDIEDVGLRRQKRECPVPKPIGLVGEILGFGGSSSDGKGSKPP